MSQEKLIYIPPYINKPRKIDEDITSYEAGKNLDSCKVFEDDNFIVYRPFDVDQLVNLSQGTKWMNSGGWNRHEFEYDNVNYNNYRIQQLEQGEETTYIMICKHPKSSKTSKFMFRVGDGTFYSPSYAGYSGANIIYKTQDKELWKWFLSQNFPYLNANLKKKMGKDVISDKTKLVYPTDFEGVTIDWGARYNSNITEIEILPGTQKIPAYTFYGLKQIKKVTMPDSVVKVGKGVFSDCSALEEVELSKSLKAMSPYMFSYCTSLKRIVIPSSVTKIEKGAFSMWGDSQLKEVVLPASIISIGDSAFRDCNNLQKINLPEGLESIGKSAFESCESLKTIELPESLETLGDAAFSFSGIRRIFIPQNVHTVGKAIIQPSVSRELASAPSMAPDDMLIHCAISEPDNGEYPSGWDPDFNLCDRTRGEEHWDNNTHRWVRGNPMKTGIPVHWNASRRDVNDDSLLYEDIDSAALPTPKAVFSDDTWEVFTPTDFNSLQAVSDYVGIPYADSFLPEYYPNLNYSDDDIKKCRFTIFYNKKDHRAYIYSDVRFRLDTPSFKTSGYGYLFDDTATEYMYATGRNGYMTRNGSHVLIYFLGDLGTPGLQKYAVNRWGTGLKNLKKKLQTEKIVNDINNEIVYGTDTYNEIRNALWYDDTNLYGNIRTGITYGDKKYLPDIRIKFPRNLRTISDMAFRDWKTIKDIRIPNSVTRIGSDAFSGCVNLEHVELSNNTEYIGEFAFRNCPKLTEVFIPKSVEHISEDIFLNCSPTLLIRCEANEQPEGWDEKWDVIKDPYNGEPTRANVEWGTKEIKLLNTK